MSLCRITNYEHPARLYLEATKCKSSSIQAKTNDNSPAKDLLVVKFVLACLLLKYGAKPEVVILSSASAQRGPRAPSIAGV